MLFAAGLGFEPRLTDSESAGLPLADPANRAHSIRILAEKQLFGWAQLELEVSSSKHAPHNPLFASRASLWAANNSF